MFALIMAGGVGTRFWPRSRQKRPKQFLSILDSRTMIQATVHRLQPLIPKEKIFVILNPQLQDQLKEQVPEILEENIILEPFGKNTAPCIGLAAIHLRQIDPDGVMVVLPSDHMIQNKKMFHKAVKIGENIARKTGGLVTLGINPDRPATGYGYIQHNEKIAEIDGIPVHKVKTFAEKPNRETALLFLKSGDFVWNSGMFIWKISSILGEIRTHIPELYAGLEKIEKAIGTDRYQETLIKVYKQTRSQSIDYGVMEKAKNVFVIKCDFGWNDVGSWDEVYKLIPKNKNGNVVQGKGVILDSENCFVQSDGDLIAVLGMKDVVVIKSDNAVLICPRERAQDVKSVVEYLKRKNMNEYI